MSGAGTVDGHHVPRLATLARRAALVPLVLAVCPAAACAAGPEAGVFPAARTTTFDGPRVALLNAVDGSVSGGPALGLGSSDYAALSAARVQGAALLDALRADLGVPTTAAALAAPVTPTQVLQAAASASQAAAFGALATSLAGRTGTIRLGDVLQLDPANATLSDVSLNGLDLATAVIEQYGFATAAAPATATVTGAALGLQSVVTSVALTATVTSPPAYVRGPAGTSFHSAGVRLKADVDLVDQTPSSAALNAALAPLGNATSTVTVQQVKLFVDLAEGRGTIAAIDAVGRAVALQSTPGTADAYLGSIPDALFLDRTHVVAPATDLTPDSVGTLRIRVTQSFTGSVLADSTSRLMARSPALGAETSAGALPATAPFPARRTTGDDATYSANLLDALTGSAFTLRLDPMGALLDPIAPGTITPTTRTVVLGSLKPSLASVFTGIVAPATTALGAAPGSATTEVDGISAARTAVRWRGGTATRLRRGVRLLWRTGRDADTLGFDVYRVRRGTARRVRLTRRLLPGGALGGGGGRHRFTDRGGRRTDRYVVVAQGLDGKRTAHGLTVRPR